MSEVATCEFCGRDTKNKCRICGQCLGSKDHGREHAAASMGPWTPWCDEYESDLSDNALGPKQAEDRMSAVWVDDDGEEWRRASQ